MDRLKCGIEDEGFSVGCTNADQIGLDLSLEQVCITTDQPIYWIDHRHGELIRAYSRIIFAQPNLRTLPVTYVTVTTTRVFSSDSFKGLYTRANSSD